VKNVKKLTKSCQKSCQKVVKKVVKKLSKSCQKVAKKLSKSCQKVAKVVKKLSRIGCESKLLTMCYFSIKSGEGWWVEWGGRAKSGSKAFGNYFVVAEGKNVDIDTNINISHMLIFNSAGQTAVNGFFSLYF
jgi:biotin operon repressor